MDPDYAREKAKSLLTHYIEILFQAAGLRWDEDNRAEIEDIVDCIIDATGN